MDFTNSPRVVALSVVVSELFPKTCTVAIQPVFVLGESAYHPVVRHRHNDNVRWMRATITTVVREDKVLSVGKHACRAVSVAISLSGVMLGQHLGTVFFRHIDKSRFEKVLSSSP